MMMMIIIMLVIMIMYGIYIDKQNAGLEITAGRRTMFLQI